MLVGTRVVCGVPHIEMKMPANYHNAKQKGPDRHNGTASLLYPIIKRKITIHAFVVFSQEN